MNQQDNNVDTVSLKKELGLCGTGCRTCEFLGSEGDGYEYNGLWDVCEKHEGYVNLKSFPFKKDMKCWMPNFWFTSFGSLINPNSGHIKFRRIMLDDVIKKHTHKRMNGEDL